MKKVIRYTSPGNAKLRGRRFAKLSCGCCVLLNLRQEFRDKEALREIKENE